MEKEILSIKKLQKKYMCLKIAFAVMIAAFIALFYINYDYMIFKILIAGNYIYTDTLDQIYETSLGQEAAGGYFRNFDEMVIAVVTEKIREINGDRYTYLYNPNQYKISKELVKAEAQEAKMETLTSDTVYLKLPNISKYVRKFIYDNREELKPYRNIVIDLRGNYGGDLSQLYKIADLFLEKDNTIGHEITRLSFFTRTISATQKQYFNFDQIIILQDENTASAAEGLILALKDNLSNVSTVGTTTFGKGIGQITIPLTGGYAVKATVLLVTPPSGVSIHKIGITPDVCYQENGGSLIEFVLTSLQL